MREDILGKVAGVSTKASEIYNAFSSSVSFSSLLDIFLVAFLIYWAYLFLRQTKALGILWGIGILALFWLLGQALQLTAINTILQWVVTSILVAIPVVFQPELRSALEKLGRTPQMVTDFRKLTRAQIEEVVDEVVQAANILAKNQYGALIVFSRQTGLREQIETGEKLFARVSSKLLVNIFTPKAPLHDGAVIISGNKIIAAGTTLPIVDDVIDLTLGTRHKAGLSLTKITDAAVLIVSEETGKISLATNGKLIRSLNLKALKERLMKYLSSKAKTPLPSPKQANQAKK